MGKAVRLARLEGFEPPAYGLEVRCSIQLSYRRAKGIGKAINMANLEMSTKNSLNEPAGYQMVKHFESDSN